MPGLRNGGSARHAMTLAGGLTFAGLIIAVAVPGVAAIFKIADAFAAELRVLVAALAGVPSGDAADDHAADGDLPNPVHGQLPSALSPGHGSRSLVDSETITGTSGKIRKFAAGGAHV
ncbi:hypothetical protein O4H52_00965 [Sphingomonadaceae bacterium G21617-S1]|nr:hypothetical protein [Sphingomonadaceae bacterium G21617-S1]